MLFEDRSRAESFGALAELYDRARPRYPPALLDALLADGAKRVLDVGCGTGIAAAQLASRGCEVLGVEVDPRMADVARAKGLRVEVAPFESWEAGGRRFELLVSAQAWHWIQPHPGAEKAAAVLEQGGRIGAFWNLGDPPAQLRERLTAIYARVVPGLENYSVGVGRHHVREHALLAGISDCSKFEPAQLGSFSWSRSYTTAGWLEHLISHSDHQALPVDQRERLLAEVGAAIDAIGGSFEMPYETVLLSARRN